MLAADIGKAIDAGGGKASIATMGGGTLTATRKATRSSSPTQAGAKATVTSADGKRSNGIVHGIDAVLMPANRPSRASDRGVRQRAPPADYSPADARFPLASALRPAITSRRVELGHGTR